MKALMVATAVMILVSGAWAEIVPPSDITVTAVGSEWHEFGPVEAVIDGTGLDVASNHTAAVMTDAWGAGGNPSIVPGNGINDGNSCMNYAMFTFGKSYLLDGLNIWNLGDWMGGAPAGLHLGTKYVVVEYSTVANPSTPADWTDWYRGDFDEQASDVDPFPATQVLDLPDVRAKHVALSQIVSWGYGGGSVYVGLAELQFNTIEVTLHGPIVDPGNITVTAVGSEWHEFGPVERVIDSVGLNVSGEHDDDMKSAWGGGAYPWVTPGNGINEGNGCMNYAVFTFDQAYPLAGLRLWNLGGWMGSANHLGSKSVVVEYSTVASPSAPADWSDWFIGDFAEQASAPVPYPATETLDLDNITARHIAVSIITDWGYSGGGVYQGLAELQFVMSTGSLVLIH